MGSATGSPVAFVASVRDLPRPEASHSAMTRSYSSLLSGVFHRPRGCDRRLMLLVQSSTIPGIVQRRSSIHWIDLTPDTLGSFDQPSVSVRMSPLRVH